MKKILRIGYILYLIKYMNILYLILVSISNRIYFKVYHKTLFLEHDFITVMTIEKVVYGPSEANDDDDDASGGRPGG
jgi:hypothetical protein